MLSAIRRHLAASAPHDAVRAEHHERHADETPRAGVTAVGGEPGASPVERFRKALEAVVGRCVVVSDEAEASEALRRIVEERHARRVAVSDSTLARRVLGGASAGVEVLEAATASEMFECDLGVTGAQWAIAETGTLVLESDAERNRLASLVPTAHVAVVESRQIRQTLGEVMQAINQRGEGALSRAITFITGPSRTSDIELTLAVGVHGPAELYVIIIEGEGP
ncbi:MAG TPA: lactate utilization protein [Pyrinomonadaceae bacterium]|jgi:L-lactate dehydrogenase complex protein LldG|nr:lactate utilization protein [Pyrinomonadaceae bacterium]